MVYIEDRISELENAVRALQTQLADAVASIDTSNARKRALDQVDKGEVELMRSELQRSIDTKIGQTQLHVAVDLALKDAQKVAEEQLAKSNAELRVMINQKVNQEQMNAAHMKIQQRITQAMMDVQAAAEKRFATTVSREQFNSTVQSMTAANTAAHAQKLGRDQLPQIQAQIQTNVDQQVQSKMQSTLDLCQGMLSTNQELFKRMSMNGGVQSWADLDLSDMSFFDTGKVYRIRIGDPPVSRWLYSTEVSQMQIFVSDNVMDQAIVVNASSKASYGARRVGAPLDQTAYYPLFQLQCRSS